MGSFCNSTKPINHTVKANSVNLNPENNVIESPTKNPVIEKNPIISPKNENKELMGLKSENREKESSSYAHKR